MKKRLRFLLITFCLVFLGQLGHRAYAQNPQTIEVGPHFGVSSYIGELNVWRDIDKWSWREMNQFNTDWGVLARYNYNSRWSFRLDYTHGKVRASDAYAAWRPDAQLNFQTTINDISLMAEFNFLDYYTGHIQNTVSPYIFAGVSGFLFSPHPFTQNDDVDKTELLLTDKKSGITKSQTEGVVCYPYSFSIPFGVGCKLSLTKHLAATVEWRMHYTFTDYLDDVSGVYPIEDENNKHAIVAGYDLVDPSGKFEAGQQRGNSQTNDWFGFINLSLTWKFVIPNASACTMNFE